MSKKAGRTKPCTAAERAGRLAKAEQFLRSAELIDAYADEDDDLADSYTTLCVHAGIAAADAICCARLGEMARGEDHRSAVELVGKVDKALANDLGALLGMKTRAGYDHTPIAGTDRKRAGRVASRLLVEARRIAGT
ncbi:MAG: hypothetical protein CL424_06475 [Acidimicrobiaceae bacterium]|nr:hypothetical protein [Acidimicrobiaceae bacterium]